jgi:plastocyanin
MRGRMRMLAVLATVALLGAACGGDSGGGDGGTTTTPPDGGNGGGEAQPLTALDFEFNPADVTVDSGGTIDFRNQGEVEHNFSVTDQDVSEDVDAGESTTITIDLDAGTYDFFCEYHPEQMTGNLTVL